MEKKSFTKKNLEFFLAYVTPRSPLSVHKKIQPNRSSRLAGYRKHIYECLVLLYRLIDIIFIEKLDLVRSNMISGFNI